MKTNYLNKYVVKGCVAFISFLLIAPGCKKIEIIKELKDFKQVNLVSNNDEYGARRIDPLFQNGWGIAFGPSGTAWVSFANTGYTSAWDSGGNDVLPLVTIPGAGDAATGGHPSGQVFNATTGFNLVNGSPAKFIFAGLDGVLSGWNGGPAAVVALDDSKSGAVYTGIALAMKGSDPYLYTANFSAGKIDVYNSTWEEVEMPFNDPDLPAGYAPYNVQAIGDYLYVTYAKVGADGRAEKAAGEGYVDTYSTDGALVSRFASKGVLNAPWAVVQAPDSFFTGTDMSAIHNAILVGNFGDGHINVFGSAGNFIGPLRSKAHPLVIDGLWGLAFPPATAVNINLDNLYFAAGPDDEEDGLYGYITK